MRKRNKRGARAALGVVTAFGLCAHLGSSAAGSEFVISVSPGTPVGNGDTDYVLSAKDEVLTDSRLDFVDCAINSIGSGTTGALVVQLADIDGDGLPDANVVGQGLQFGSGAGTFVGIPGKPTGTTPSAAVTAPLVVPKDVFSLNGPIDPQFVNGTVHHIEVIRIFSDPSGAPSDGNQPVPFANIVVPTGTAWGVSVGLASNESRGIIDSQLVFSQPIKPLIGYTTSLPANSHSIGLIGFPSDAPQTVPVSGAAQEQGSIILIGPATHSPIVGSEPEIGLAIHTDPETSLATVISSLNTNLQFLNPGASIVEVSPDQVAGTPFVGDDAEVFFPNGAGDHIDQTSFFYDLSAYGGTATVTSLTEFQFFPSVPEPTGAAPVALGLIGLLARKTRRRLT